MESDPAITCAASKAPPTAPASGHQHTQRLPRPPPPAAGSRPAEDLLGTWRQLSVRRRDFCQQQKYVGSMLPSFNADSARGPPARPVRRTWEGPRALPRQSSESARQGHQRGGSALSQPGLARTRTPPPASPQASVPVPIESRLQRIPWFSAQLVYSLAEGQPQQEPC